MLELKSNQLVFSFPQVHPLASMNIDFQRTFRIPDDGKSYPLPPSLGVFPMVHVDDHSDNVPSKWIEHGGTILPMYQAEALWINFPRKYDNTRESAYPFAVKISTGKIDAITGEEHTNGLNQNPQDYLSIPQQPWLDGYCVGKGKIRQFVAMPLGEGYTAEEQLTGEAEHGGIQIVVYPMKAEVFEKRFPKIDERRLRQQTMYTGCWGESSGSALSFDMARDTGMGLAPGGTMQQQIYEDHFDINDWDQENKSRCFIHLANSMVWHKITGMKPPHMPPSANDYNRCGLPWFDYYDENSKPLKGSSNLANLKSVHELSKKNDDPIDNESFKVKNTVKIKAKRSADEVREGDF